MPDNTKMTQSDAARIQSTQVRLLSLLSFLSQPTTHTRSIHHYHLQTHLAQLNSNPPLTYPASRPPEAKTPEPALSPPKHSQRAIKTPMPPNANANAASGGGDNQAGYQGAQGTGPVGYAPW